MEGRGKVLSIGHFSFFGIKCVCVYEWEEVIKKFNRGFVLF